MTYAKAQLDHARQKEKDCFDEDFERANNELVTIMSGFIRARKSAGTHDIVELEDDSDISSLGPVPRLTPRRIRAPTRASTRPTRHAGRQNVASDESISGRDDSRTVDTNTRRALKMLSRQTATRRAAARGSPKPLKHPPFYICPTLAKRALFDDQFRALLETVATGNADQDKRDAFQRHVDDVRAQQLRAGYKESVEYPPETPFDQTFHASVCLRFFNDGIYE